MKYFETIRRYFETIWTYFETIRRYFETIRKYFENDFDSPEPGFRPTINSEGFWGVPCGPPY